MSVGCHRGLTPYVSQLPKGVFSDGFVSTFLPSINLFPSDLFCSVNRHVRPSLYICNGFSFKGLKETVSVISDYTLCLFYTSKGWPLHSPSLESEGGRRRKRRICFLFQREPQDVPISPEWSPPVSLQTHRSLRHKETVSWPMYPPSSNILSGSTWNSRNVIHFTQVVSSWFRHTKIMYSMGLISLGISVFHVTPNGPGPGPLSPHPLDTNYSYFEVGPFYFCKTLLTTTNVSLHLHELWWLDTGVLLILLFKTQYILNSVNFFNWTHKHWTC